MNKISMSRPSSWEMQEEMHMVTETLIKHYLTITLCKMNGKLRQLNALLSIRLHENNGDRRDQCAVHGLIRPADLFVCFKNIQIGT